MQDNTKVATQLPKETVRSYLAERQRSHEPPPSPDEIRRRLDWQLLPNNDIPQE